MWVQFSCDQLPSRRSRCHPSCWQGYKVSTGTRRRWECYLQDVIVFLQVVTVIESRAVIGRLLGLLRSRVVVHRCDGGNVAGRGSWTGIVHVLAKCTSSSTCRHAGAVGVTCWDTGGRAITESERVTTRVVRVVPALQVSMHIM